MVYTEKGELREKRFGNDKGWVAGQTAFGSLIWGITSLASSSGQKGLKWEMLEGVQVEVGVKFSLQEKSVAQQICC